MHVEGHAPEGLACAAIADASLLGQCWQDVLAGDRADGELGAGVSRFSEDADRRVAELVEDLRAGNWRPDLLTRVEILREEAADVSFTCRRCATGSWSELCWRV